MPKEPHEAKIVVEGKGDQKEIKIHDPVTGRTVQTGHNVAAKDVECEVEKVAETMRRAGNRVTYREA